jgi:hypothetical protein
MYVRLIGQSVISFFFTAGYCLITVSRLNNLWWNNLIVLTYKVMFLFYPCMRFLNMCRRLITLLAIEVEVTLYPLPNIGIFLLAPPPPPGPPFSLPFSLSPQSPRLVPAPSPGSALPCAFLAVEPRTSGGAWGRRQRGAAASSRRRWDSSAEHYPPSPWFVDAELVYHQRHRLANTGYETKQSIRSAPQPESCFLAPRTLC